MATAGADDPALDDAVSKVAATQRGRRARKEAAEQKHAATQVAAMQKGRNERRHRQKQADAATMVQAKYRGKTTRERVGGQSAQRYYSPAEVAQHDRADDLWLSIFHKVYDLTALVAENRGLLVQPLIDAAGTDVTHWFDRDTKALRKYVDPATGLKAPFLPMGRFLHAAPAEPAADWSTEIGIPWWKQKEYMIGKLTRKTRRIKLFNMLTQQEALLEVCSEETLLEIQQRYLAYNEHSAAYTWKRTDTKVARVLDMSKTLEGNGIHDETENFDALNIEDDFYVPMIQIYFSDDLTVA